MAFFRKLFRKTSTSADVNSAEGNRKLRDQLFAAANNGDPATLLSLCRKNRDDIVQQFPAWKNMKAHPDVDLKDLRQVQYVINGLGAIAEAFRDKLGDSSLWDQLVGPIDKNPHTQFEQILKKARDLCDQMRQPEAADLLTAYLIDIKDLAGTGADNFRAYAHGLLGLCRFHSARAADALDHYRQALSLCAKLSDREGQGVYLGHLYEAYRYLGRPTDAAEYADLLAEHHVGTPDSDRWRNKSALIRAGEPLVRMVIRQGDAKVELDEISSLEGEITFLFERNRPNLAPALALVNGADKLAASGKLDDALGIYRDAATADPFDPHPHYAAAHVLRLLERYPEAVEEYETTGQLAPGWFNTDSNLWLAQEVLVGRVTHGAILVIWAVEDTAQKPAEKLSLIEQALVRHPSLPHLHFLNGLTLRSLDRIDEAVAAFRKGLSLNPEPDVHSRLLAQLATMSEKSDQRRLFQEILQLPGANLMSQSLAKVMIRMHAGNE